MTREASDPRDDSVIAVDLVAFGDYVKSHGGWWSEEVLAGAIRAAVSAPQAAARALRRPKPVDEALREMER